jgi:hypothetical protein
MRWRAMFHNMAFFYEITRFSCINNTHKIKSSKKILSFSGKGG